MTKKELIKELEKLVDKEEVEQLEEGISKEEKEKINKLLDESSSYIICTDKGMKASGNYSEFMNILTRIVIELKDSEMPKCLIKFAVENGLSEVNNLDEALDLLKKGLEWLKGE